MSTVIDHTDLIKRLREEAIIKPGRSNRLDYINPDGPEAADALEAQAAKIAELESALGSARFAGKRLGAMEMQSTVATILKRRISQRDPIREDFSIKVHENVLYDVERIPLPAI